MKTTITLTRPNTDTEFFNPGVLPQTEQLGQWMMWMYEQEQNDVCVTTNVLSEDKLTLTRTIEWKSEEDRLKFREEWDARFMWVTEARTAYLEAHGHTFDLVTA